MGSMGNVYAELVINVEAPLENTFHYHVPSDLQDILSTGHLVEVEFGRRLAQGIVLALHSTAPVEETKPIIALIDPLPVVYSWQMELAQWMSRHYLAPLNACLRLMLPPGLTRWADVTVELNPRWDGSGRLTAAQEAIIALLQEHGDVRGQRLKRLLPKALRSEWQKAVNQLAQRDIVMKGTILEPPRARPHKIRTAELIAGPKQLWASVLNLGRDTIQSRLLHYLAQSADPLPREADVLEATGASASHLDSLLSSGWIQRTQPAQLVVPTAGADCVPDELVAIYQQLPLEAQALEAAAIAQLEALGLARTLAQPAALNLAHGRHETLEQVFRLRNGQKYWSIIQYLAREARPVAVSELYEATDSAITHLRRLQQQDLIRLGSQEVWRDPLADRDFVPSEPPTLTTDQARVWQTIRRAMTAESTANRAFLLHGVTGSGKTEIYMHAIDLALEAEQRAIVLVPEIALTPQTVRRFAARFPGRVAILHSKLSDGERYDTWRRARQGQFDIVVGPRSALFTPFSNLGVIVLDEEHDHSYKQGPPVRPPFYHARETAIELAQLTGATVLLGSATPDLVTYHHARAGRLTLLELPRRVMGHRARIESQVARLNVQSRYAHHSADAEETYSIPLPPVRLVDMRQELRAGNRSIFSRLLQSSVDETLQRNEQTILFLNRRGSATFVLCRDCGHVLSCPRCDIPLTYHRSGATLVCHHCGRSEAQPGNCPQCGSERIKYFGLGTEELERMVRWQWPDSRTVRWDSDTTGGKDSHEQLLSSFINHEADILVGTQMIAKGLDLPLVTLVGVISADVSLGLPDFSTGERTFQVLTQVAGRAGRGLLGGRVIVQTYKPEHYAIQAAVEHDYVSFYLDEIRFRTQHSYPPFRRLAKLLLVDAVNDRGRRMAEELAAQLRQHCRDKALGATEVIGPAPPFFNRIDGRYRWQILVRSPDPVRLLDDFAVPRPWLVDIDPVTTL